MRVFPTEGDDKVDRLFVTPAEHQNALQKAPDRETYLSFRYGAHSLRRQSILTTPLSNLERIETEYGDIHFLRVDAKDSSDRPQQTRERDVFISDSLVRDTYDYYGRDYNGPIFRGSKSTLTDRYKETREALVEDTGKKAWENFSSQDGRRYFATHALFRHGLPIELVMQLGGWNSIKAMQPYLVIPEDVMARIFGSKGLLTSFDTESGNTPSPPYRVNHALKTIEQAATGEYDDLSTKQLAHEVARALGDDVLGEIGADTSDAAPMSGDDIQQRSFTDFFGDEEGVTDVQVTAQAAKATYVTVLVYISWIISFGPLA